MVFLLFSFGLSQIASTDQFSSDYGHQMERRDMEDINVKIVT